MNNKTYHIITIGCQMNKSDSERIAAVFEELGFKEASERRHADFVVLTTCGVRQAAEDRAFGLVARIKKENKDVKIVLAGCLSEREDVVKKLKDVVDIWLPARRISDFRFMILDLIESSVDVRRTADVGRLGTQEYLSIKPKYDSSFSAFVPIGNGCDNFCTYCVVPYARGREVYRPACEIIAEVEELVKRGYKEITLIAQNVNSYFSGNMEHVSGNIKHETCNMEKNSDNMKHETCNTEKDLCKKNKTDDCDQGVACCMLPVACCVLPDGCFKKRSLFSDLLRAVNTIPGDFWIRFATSHPKDMSDDLISAINDCEKVCKHIHLPAQAGDTEILRAMNRKYSVEHYLGLIKKIKENIRGEFPVALTTDIIVGFPGEARGNFLNTVKLFETVKYDMAYIAQYSPRPGTAAEKMADNVLQTEKKQREKELTEVLRKTALENNQFYLDKTVRALVEGQNKKGELIARTGTNKTVKFASEKDLIGKFVKIKITKIQDFGLTGVLEK